MKTSNKLRNFLLENLDVIRKEKISSDCLIGFLICLANEKDNSKNRDRSKHFKTKPKFQND